MTSTTIRAVSNGTTPAAGSGTTTKNTTNATGRPRGIARLRDLEAQALISLACDAISAAGDAGHDLHTAIYRPENSEATDTGRVLLDALACLETADHYLRMLDGILIPASPDDPGPEPA
jgi:hypothetical protein